MHSHCFDELLSSEIQIVLILVVMEDALALMKRRMDGYIIAMS